MFLFLVTQSLVVAFQPCMEWIPIEKKTKKLLNVQKLLAGNRRNISSLSDCNVTRTHNHWVHKQTLNDLAKLAKWLSCVVSTYLYGAFEFVFFWFNHLASLANWLSVGLRTKWLWVRVPLQPPISFIKPIPHFIPMLPVFWSHQSR